MTRHKNTTLLALTLTTLAITATPAVAAFRGLSGTSGSSQLKAGTVASFQLIPGGSAIESSKAPDTWRIQDSKTKQDVTKEGPHLDQRVNFENPHIGTTPVELNNPIEYQIVQLSPNTAEALLSKTVHLTIPLGGGAFCAVTLLPSANRQLTKVTVTDIEASKSLEVGTDITDLTSESAPEASCKAAGVPPSSTTGVFNQTTIEHGVILV
jgi:hypothetical protein